MSVVGGGWVGKVEKVAGRINKEKLPIWQIGLSILPNNANGAFITLVGFGILLPFRLG